MAKTRAAKQLVRKPVPATKTKTKATAKAPPGWVDAGSGYRLGIRGDKLVARRDDADLASVPKPLRDGPVGERLTAALDFLDDHARTCAHTVETWMLRSLAVPRAVLAAVMPDEHWATALRDLWIVGVADDNTVQRERGGFFRGVDPAKGIGAVDRDGETTWLATDRLLIPHPILLDELDDLRQMAIEIGAAQGIDQLVRETFAVPATPPPDPMEIATYAGGDFAMLQQATGLAKRLGYRVSGGAACCRVLERGRFVEARFDLGGDDGMYETTTGNLAWVDERQRPIAVCDVPPIAFSEGMRMAAKIHAKRKVDKDGSDD
jgi:hypothetical protein